MHLYDLELSGNCYKVRLFAALNALPLECIAVDFLGGAHKRPPVIDLNPWGQLPVLQDGEIVMRDAQAILVYLARKYALDTWLPRDAAGEAAVMQWLSVAANEIQHGPATARLVDKFQLPFDKDVALARSAFILPLIDQHLAQQRWLATGQPSIADCAAYPYLALAHEGGIDLADYRHLRAWLRRVEDLPGYVAVPGLDPARS